MEPALFSPAALFGPQEDEDGDVAIMGGQPLEYVDRCHEFPGMVLSIREFAFHALNANLLWPGALSFANWLVVHQHVLKGQKILELGSGTGALAIFLRKAFSVDITTSDYNDEIIEQNIAFNCEANGVEKLAHIRHTWGDTFPAGEAHFDLIIASDILLYVKQYPNLIKTLVHLLKDPVFDEGFKCSLHAAIAHLKPSNHSNMAKKSFGLVVPHNLELPKPSFLMSWRRRLPKEEENIFFDCCKDGDLSVHHLGSRVYCIFRAK